MKFTTLYMIDDCLLTRITNKRNLSENKTIKIIGDFSNFKEYFEQMKKEESDIVLINISVLNQDYDTYIKKIKEMYPTTKIIIITSEKNKKRLFDNLSDEIQGFILEKNTNNINKAIMTVTNGGVWIDFELAKYIFIEQNNYSKRNLNNFYENKKLKESLTKRELEVLKLITEGKTNSEIAKEIIVSTNTAKAHVGSILTKLSVTDRVQAAVKATKANLF